MSKLTISRFWKKVPLSVGTIDNIGVVPVEISTDEENSIIIYPMSRFSYKDVELFIRSTGQDTAVSLVEFMESRANSCNGGVTEDGVASDSDIDEMFK